MSTLTQNAGRFLQVNRPVLTFKPRLPKETSSPVLTEWRMSETAAQQIEGENGINFIDSLFGLKVKTLNDETMNGFIWGLLNPDGTGVAVTADLQIVKVKLTDGKLQVVKEPANETK